MKTFPLTDFAPQADKVIDAAFTAPVTLTTHGEPKLVMMTVEEYEFLARNQRAFTVADAPDHIHAELMEAIEEILEETRSSASDEAR